MSTSESNSNKTHDSFNYLCIPVEGSWFVTFTLKPKYYKHSVKVQFYKTQFEISRVLTNEHIESSAYVTEVTQSCNIHYHAWIKYHKHIDNQYANIMLAEYWRKIGFIKVTPNQINSIESRQRVYHYMGKADKIIKDIIPYDITVVQSYTQKRSALLKYLDKLHDQKTNIKLVSEYQSEPNLDTNVQKNSIINLHNLFDKDNDHEFLDSYLNS